MEIEVPQFMVEATGIPGTDEIILNLVITTSGSMSRYFLCEARQNYQDIAKQMHDKINEAGRAARRQQSGLVVVTDLPDGLKNGGRNAKPVRSAKR